MPPGQYPNRESLVEIILGSPTDPADEDFTSVAASLLALVKGTSSRAARIESLIDSDFLAVPNVISFSDVDNSVVFEVRLVDKSSGPVPAAQITPGTIQVSRWRAGVETSIVAATPFSKGDGRIYYAYTFAAASWARDDTSTATAEGIAFEQLLGTIDEGTVDAFFDPSVALPVGPVLGDRYIASATGNGWTIHNIYEYDGAAWTETAAAVNMFVQNTDDGERWWFSGSIWELGTRTRYAEVAPWFTILQDISTLEGKVDTIDANVDALMVDLGDPSARTNLKSIELMLGNPDTALMSVWSQIKALNALAIGAGNVPTAGTIADVLHKNGSYTYSKATDSLEAVRDALDAALLALQTQLGTPSVDVLTDLDAAISAAQLAVTNAISASEGVVTGAIGTHDTDIKTILGAPAVSVSADIVAVGSAVAGVKSDTEDLLAESLMGYSTKVYMCTLASQINALAFSNVAANKDFPNVVIPASAVPAGAAVVAAYLVLFWRKQKDSSGATNAVNAANKSVRIKAAAGVWGTGDIIATTFANGALQTDANNTEASPLIIGTIDISSVVTGPGTYNIRSEQTTRSDALTVTAASLTLHDVASGIQLVTRPALPP